jgi:hypothetical protein
VSLHLELGFDVARITSYINNLEPLKFGGLYKIIEEVLTCAIPMFNESLSILRYDALEPERIECTEIEYPEGQSEDAFYKKHRYNPEEHGDDENAHWERLEEMKREREPILPDPGEFKPPDRSVVETGGKKRDADGTVKMESSESHDMLGVNLARDYPKGIQVIVKLANIELTPEKPTYDGGSWHVEGQLVCYS